MTILLRQQVYLREENGARVCIKLLPMLYYDHPDGKQWTKRTWLNRLEKASSKKRLQYCWDSDGHVVYMRALQGLSGGKRLMYLGRTMWTSRAIGLIAFITLVLPITAIPFFNQF